MDNFQGLFKHADNFDRRKAGEVIFEAGTHGEHMYVVRSGQVAIKVGDEVVETVGEGGLVGEMALLDDTARSASAVAATDCEIYPVDQRRFLFLIQQTPFFALAVMRTMASRLRAMNKRV
jgi:CRP-like cAMP-binding protein